MQKKEAIKKPFFSKFLEAQKVDKIKDLKGGGSFNVTHKYPSDNDEEGPLA